jgi:catechol 2,3-dioxygenase-like lactoylglutathione lyase family enzyme
MLRNALVCATVPTTDLERSARFYEETLGMTGARLGLEGGLYYEAGGGSLLYLYESAVPASEHAVATFIVEDLDEIMAGLRSRGVAFEEYDLPGLRTENGVFTADGFRAAWFKDPDRNVIGLRSY